MKSWSTKNNTTIYRILFGRSNVFLIANKRSRILVDTGWSGDGARLLNKIGKTGNPDAVILTHTHFDHTGNAGMLREKFAPVFIVQECERAFLESGDSPTPKGTKGWSRFIYNLGAEKVPHWFQVQGVKADFTFTDEYSLSEYGFNAMVLHTPGHSAGSSSLIVGNEIALVGDAMVGMPGSIFPPWGDDETAIIRSWKILLDTGCISFHPAHGLPVTRSRLEAAYTRQVTRHRSPDRDFT
jgi:glyoxylase-like metal-dependent hydrolase (beta-lactamase superfamily II)